MKKKSIRIVGIVAVLLLVPAAVMLFSDNVRWTASDFVIAGALLLGAGFAYELLITKLSSRKHQIIAAALLALAFVYLWAELAVGLFTNLGS